MFKKFAVSIHFYSFFEAIQLFSSKNLGHSKSPNFSFFFLVEMPALNSNEKIACLECGREYTRKDASRHRNHCDVSKCSNCYFYTCSSEELTNHIKKKHCQHNVQLISTKCLINFSIVNIMLNIMSKINFLLKLKSLYTKFLRYHITFPGKMLITTETVVGGVLLEASF